jgi:uncharacterized protein (TIGR02246 family)
MKAHSPAEIHKLFLDAFNRGDVEGVVALYEPNAVLIVAGQTVIAHDAIRETYGRLFARKGRMQLETHSSVASTDGLAVLHGSWTFEFPTAHGNRTTHGMSTEVVRRQADGTWLFVIDEPYTAERAM